MRNYLTILLIVARLAGYSQCETSSWLLHNAMQFDFIGDSIQLTHKATYQYSWFTLMPMNTSCINDTAGNLLFATNAEWIINANNDTMPNGYLLGNMASGQSMIIPAPSTLGIYYVFTTGRYYSMTDFRYSKIDMSLDNGLGDVVASQSNILLQTGITDKVTALRHANGVDIWVVTHENNNNSFVAYLVTKEGISSAPITSNAGTIIVDAPPFDIFDAACQGTIKCSPCGRRIAIASKGLNMVEVFDFDTEAGTVSNPVNINIPFAYYLEFSNDGNMLYCSTETSLSQPNDTMRIFQINLLELGSLGIQNSKYRVNNPQNFPQPRERPAIQLAVDGKIYVSYKFAIGSPPHFGVISSPHLSGVNCNFVHDQYMAPISAYGTNFNSFPNFMTSYFDKNVFATTPCFGDSTMIYTLNSELFDSIRWEINDPSTGLHVFYNQDTVYHLYSQAGHYTVHCLRYRGTYIDDFEKKLQVLPYAQAMLQDTTLCAGEQVQLSFTGNFGTNVYWYRQQPPWNMNWVLVDSGQVLTVSEEGYYLPKIDYWDVCGDKPDTSFVSVIDIALDLGDDTLSGNCITNKYWLAPQWNINDVDFWQWSTGSSNFLIMPNSSGMYSLYASGGNCEEEDSVYVLYDEPLSIDLGPDLQLCDDSVWLEIAAPSDDYFWMPTGDTTQGIFASESGQYIGMAVNACGGYSDTINVLIWETPPELFGLDTTICAGDSLLTDPPILEATYAWSTGDTVPNIYLYNAGNYNLTISNFCGIRVMEIVLAHDSLLQLSLADTLWLSSGDSAFIEAGVDATSYFWSTGATYPFIWVSETGVYHLTVSNACNESTDSVYVVHALNNHQIRFENNIILYPNPVENSFIIEIEEQMIGSSLSIHSMLGIQILETELTSTRSEVKLKPFPAGNYVVRIASKTKVFTKRLIINLQ